MLHKVAAVALSFTLFQVALGAEAAATTLVTAHQHHHHDQQLVAGAAVGLDVAPNSSAQTHHDHQVDPPPTPAADEKPKIPKPVKKPEKKTEALQTPTVHADPALAAFGIYEKSAPNPTTTTPVATTLPLVLNTGDRIALVGNTLLESAQDFGHIESLIYQAHAQSQLVIRNFSWSADEVDLQPRPTNFATVAQHLTREKMDVIFAAFGFNESFAGVEKIPVFKQRLAKYLETLRTSAFNGKTGPRVVLLSPTANENLPGVPAAEMNNARLALYTAAMAEVAAVKQVGFVDLFGATQAAMADTATPLTINGVHLNEAGYAFVASEIFRGVFGQTPPAVQQDVRAMVIDKNKQFFRRYRPLNTYYYTGGRSNGYGYLDFLPAMRNFDLMTENREQRIWALAQGKTFVGVPVDDSNLPVLDQVIEGRGANEWLSAADEQASFKVDPRFEVNLFASEEQFPDLAKPVQMRWDAKGRLWVCCSSTYPHVYPGKEPGDKIIILEDTNNDGKADKSTVWADDLHIPLSFELIENGVLLSEQPNLTRILDTDGDGKADRRDVLLSGFGCEDSHHSLHDFVWTPDGDLLFRESVFHHSQVETAYGPVRAENSAWFSFRPETQRLMSFGNYPNTNPWGVTFDDWGNHVASHPIFANAFHAPNPPYPMQHPAATGIPAYSGTCGHEFVDFPMWPKELQGGFIKVRYKPTNRVEMHQWIEKEDHYEEKYLGDVIFSQNLSFIPVDVRFGPTGAMYVCDWYNPVKGHAQYSLRDPRRDRTSGRIWRIIPKGATLQQAPIIAGAPIPALLEILKRAEYSYRYWTRRELRARDVNTVASALDRWVMDLDKNDPRFRHHQIEAVWLYRTIGVQRPELLTELLGCENHHARVAATQQLRYWHAAFADDGISLLSARAKDQNARVRMEAVTAASYIATRAAIDAVMPIMHEPMDTHLRYATVCAFGSENLRRIWEKDPMLSSMITSFMQTTKKAVQSQGYKEAKNATDSSFDGQKELATVEISSVPERMLFSPTQFTVKPGQPVKLIFSNPDAMQHNLVIVKPGAMEEVGMLGNEMAKDPNGIKANFVPKSDKILFATTLVNPHDGQVLRFIAPQQPGDYPFVCTFPGHWIIMNGKMTVK